MKPFQQDNWSISYEAIKLVPEKIATKYHVFPLSINGDLLTLGVDDEFGFDSYETLKYLLGRDFETKVVEREWISESIEKYYQAESNSKNSYEVAEPKVVFETGSGNVSGTEGFVRELVDKGIQRGASDIHWESQGDGLVVRYRLDGELVEQKLEERREVKKVISHVKLLARMRIDQKRLPQDGRIKWDSAEKHYDLRISSLPTVHGESLVMRILDREDLNLDFESIGLLGENRKEFEKMLSKRDGLVLVSGPTGSGKTTTLYSALKFRNRLGGKVITVEDPIEYEFAEFSQIPVRENVGMTFPTALRSVLRQSPDTIMIGEIRDAETAQIAINAALTGHLVLSTVHANDGLSAVSRLKDLGIKPFLIASALRGVVGQRLVRKLCSHCNKATGCAECAGSGFKGRIGVFEVINIDDELSEAIGKGAEAHELRDQVNRKVLIDDGLDKVEAGLTTVEEVRSLGLAFYN